MGAVATGTLTVLSWYAGWLFCSCVNGTDSKWIKVEAAVLLCALFQLAVGAGAFSRLYYGWLFGHDLDLFHSLSNIFIQEHEMIISADIVDWWVASSQQRFTGLAWWICEAADLFAHQIPFISFCYLLKKKFHIWNDVVQELPRVWPVAALSGPLHRIVWDYCTCGHAWCDGPYRGFLTSISRCEQFLWHLLPGVFLVLFLGGHLEYSWKGVWHKHAVAKVRKIAR